jgi:uncharacterized membrane protein HdeD (DUF308 family)
MNLDPTAYVLLAAVIAGVTELLNRLRAKDYWVATTIFTAAVIGGLFGVFHYAGVSDFVNGIAIGFGASGALTAIGIVGNRSIPAPSKALTKE